MADKLKCGIIGTGWIAGNYADSFSKLETAEITAVADHTPAKAEAFCRRFGLDKARIYAGHREMLAAEKLDLVCVCTANGMHAACSVDAMKAGVHVLCEKPMSVTLAEAREMCRVSEESGCLLSIAFQPRMDANMRHLKEIVESGILGRIYYVQTGGGRRRGIPTPFGTSFIEKEKAGLGALGDIGCYSLDMVLNALGYPKPLTVSGYTSAFFGTDPAYYIREGKPAAYAGKFGVDDFAAAFIRLEGGIVLDFRIAWAMNIDSPCDTVILGTKGGLRIYAEQCWSGGLSRPMTLYYEEDGRQCQRDIPLIEGDPYIFDAKVRAFCECVAKAKAGLRVEPESPGHQILINQAILHAIAESAEQGREVELKL